MKEKNPPTSGEFFFREDVVPNKGTISVSGVLSFSLP
jgi:hypothetical protein